MKLIPNDRSCPGWTMMDGGTEMSCNLECSLYDNCGNRRAMVIGSLQFAIKDINETVRPAPRLRHIARREVLLRTLRDAMDGIPQRLRGLLKQETINTYQLACKLLQVDAVNRLDIIPKSENLIPPKKQRPFRIGRTEQKVIDIMYGSGITEVNVAEMKAGFKDAGIFGDPDSALRSLVEKGLFTRSRNSFKRWQYRTTLSTLKNHATKATHKKPLPGWVLWKDFVKEAVRPGEELSPCDFGNLKKTLMRTMGLKFSYLGSRLYLTNKEKYYDSVPGGAVKSRGKENVLEPPPITKPELRRPVKGFFDKKVVMQNEPPLPEEYCRAVMRRPMPVPMESDMSRPCYGKDFLKYNECYGPCAAREICEKATNRYFNDKRNSQMNEVIFLLNKIQRGIEGLMTKPQASRLIKDAGDTNDLLRRVISIWQ